MHLQSGFGSSGRWTGSFDKNAKFGVREYETVIHLSDVLISYIFHIECPLPPLSALLENPRIRETDSLVICVQIHCPSGPSFPQQPSIYSVPRDLLDGLEASLDNSSQS